MLNKANFKTMLSLAKYLQGCQLIVNEIILDLDD